MKQILLRLRLTELIAYTRLGQNIKAYYMIAHKSSLLLLM